MKYLLYTIALIKTWGDNYPPLKYMLGEEEYHMELKSYVSVPQIYLEMYLLGGIGDFSSRVLKSPSYKGDQELKTYPEHNRNTVYYLEQAIKHAGHCRSLRKKIHFNKILYPLYIEICTIYQEAAIALKEVELKRREVMSQSNCRDLTWEGNPNCPEIDLLNQEAGDLHEEAEKKVSDILEPLRGKIVSRM